VTEDLTGSESLDNDVLIFYHMNMSRNKNTVPALDSERRSEGFFHQAAWGGLLAASTIAYLASIGQAGDVVHDRHKMQRFEIGADTAARLQGEARSAVTEAVDDAMSRTSDRRAAYSQEAGGFTVKNAEGPYAGELEVRAVGDNRGRVTVTRHVATSDANVTVVFQRPGTAFSGITPENIDDALHGASLVSVQAQGLGGEAVVTLRSGNVPAVEVSGIFADYGTPEQRAERLFHGTLMGAPDAFADAGPIDVHLKNG
jgi:hypothetical protein